MPPTFWDRLWLWLGGVCYPSGDKYGFQDLGDGQVAFVCAMEKAVDTDYFVGTVLGKGGFGLVKEGIHRKTLSKAALKFVERERLSERDEQLIVMEASILTGLAHGNVVEMRGFYRWDAAYCLALEHMGGGELCADIIRRVFYSEACARRIILQVLDALTFLHRRGIVHRDIKPENLLLQTAGSDHVKLADFGLATFLSPPTYKVVEPVGTPGYAAPELLRMMPYDTQVDMFSLGVIAFVLLSGYLPFGGSTIKEVVKATVIGNPSFEEIQWSATSEEARDFVKLLLKPSPSERPTAESATFHPWMKANGRALLTRTLSDRRSGRPKSLLLEFQKSQRVKLKAAVGAVVAANRLKNFLMEGRARDEESSAAANPGEDQAEAARGVGKVIGGEGLIAMAS